jgi:hypothetical protein
MSQQNSTATPERGKSLLKKESLPVRTDVSPTTDLLSPASQASQTTPGYAQEVHERAETVTTLLAGILARPTQVRRWGINE